MTLLQRAPFFLMPLLTTAAISALAPKAKAFPELTRHGYTSCTACHTAPNGGGALTPYGRNLSRELLSTWGAPREAEVLHGALPKAWMESLESSPLRFGGDLRYIQTHRENSNVRAGQFFLMQANVEIAYDQGAWAVAVSSGKIEDPRGSKEIRFVSPRYYGLLRSGENLNFRAGRFSTAFGINLADHTLSVRRPLGLGPEVERDNLELSWLGEKDQAFLSIMNSAPSTPENDRERAVVLRYDRILGEKSRIGGSFWQGDGGALANDSSYQRFMLALHSIVNISESWFFTGEIDRQERLDKPSTGTQLTQSQYAFLRIHAEPVRGVVPFLQFQHERGDVNLEASEANKYGLGLNWYPRPHFEFLGTWNRVSRQGVWSDEAYLLLHYYL